MLDSKIAALKRKLQESRYRLYKSLDDIAEPYLYMTFVTTKEVWRISTNGHYIYFNPDWLSKLSDMEMDFILSHELMHILMGHINRPQYYQGDRYHMAADVVANGRLNLFGWNYERLPHIGRIRYQTFFPTKHGSELTSVEAVRCMPVDPGTMPPAKRRQMLIDSDEWWDRKDAGSECGVVVLSQQDEDPDDLVFKKTDFNGKYKYKSITITEEFGGNEENHDDVHSNVIEEVKKQTPKSDIKRMIEQLRKDTQRYEHIYSEECAGRVWNDAEAKTLDWRKLLHSFVQEEINDYSFTPPDHRMMDCDFFLPEYNAKTENVHNVYFMVDSSGSVTDDKLDMAFSEIKDALEQFDNMLSGVICFFDTYVRSVKAFDSVTDICSAKPSGGGGTDYECIFDFIRNVADGLAPTSLVIITDGEGTYPDEEACEGTPILWLMTSDKQAPWGKNVLIQ